jgi:hypothetical protein
VAAGGASAVRRGASGTIGFDGADGGPVAPWFVAVTVNVYSVKWSRPVTVIGLPEPATLLPPGDAVTVYETIGESPEEFGGEKLTVASPRPATAVTAVGAPGGVADSMALLAAEAAPRSVPLNAVTVNVYEIPVTRPETTIGLPWPDAVAVPGDDFTVYEVTVPVAGVKATLA